MKLNYILSCLLLMICVPVAQAKLARIHQVIVKGNKIIDTKAVLAKLSSQVKSQYKSNQVREDVRHLFDTGWFSDISVDLKYRTSDSVILTYLVKENPIVEKITYQGNDHISQKEIKKIFLFSEYELLDHKKIRKSIEGVKEEYKKKGYYFAEVSHNIKPTDHPGKVHLIINIEEKTKTVVKRINFIGNHSISSKALKSYINTKESGLLSLLSSAHGSYNKAVLDQDLQIIKFLYMDKGYWQVQVEQPEVFVSPDQTSISINVSITEGEKYEVGSIGFSVDLIFGTEFLKDDLETEEAEVLSYGKLQRDIKIIQGKYGDEGYAFVNVIPKFSTLSANSRVIHVLFEIQKGKQVQVRRIHITGNSYTRDKVIRREIRIFENEMYHETNKNRSIENIKRLGFFEDVQIMPKTVSGRDDLVDMEVSVKERDTTGAFTIGLKYSGYEHLSATGKIHKMNLFGRGHNVGLDVDVNKIRQNININFSDPYFLDSDWYFEADLFFRYWNDRACDQYEKQNKKYNERLKANDFSTEEERLSEEKDVALLKKACLLPSLNSRTRGFSEQVMGGLLTIGRSLSDNLRVKLSHGVSNNTIIEHIIFEKGNEVTVSDVVDENSSGLRNPLELAVEYDKRNDRILPTQGFFSRSSITYNGLIGDFNYLTLSANLRFYQELVWNLVFRANFNYGHHVPLGADEFIPRDQLFRLGGMESLRGFHYFSIGPRREETYISSKDPSLKTTKDFVYGGLQQFYMNLELQLPILRKQMFMGVLFFDMGSAHDSWSSVDIRSSWGAGIRVITPMGPIRFEVGFPLKPREELGEKSHRFDFTIGFPF